MGGVTLIRPPATIYDISATLTFALSNLMIIGQALFGPCRPLCPLHQPTALSNIITPASSTPPILRTGTTNFEVTQNVVVAAQALRVLHRVFTDQHPRVCHILSLALILP